MNLRSRGTGDRIVHSFPRGRARSLGKLSAVNAAIACRVCGLVLTHAKQITHPRGVTLPLISEYLAARKRSGLSASSIKLIVVALKIFFRFLAGKKIIERDPTETLSSAADRTLSAGNAERIAGGAVDREHRHKTAIRFARSCDDRIALRERAAHFRTGERASGKSGCERAHPACHGQGQQDASCSGGTKGMCGDRELSFDGTTETGEAAHGQ